MRIRRIPWEDQARAAGPSASPSAARQSHVVGADPEHGAGARHERFCVDEMQPVADERRDQDAAALGEVRADRFKMVDELGEQVVRERTETREDDLVRSQRGRALDVAFRTSGMRDGDVGVARCRLAEGVLHELANLLVHRTERTPSGLRRASPLALSATVQRGRQAIQLSRSSH
jgi:hypothetical protein